MKRGKARELYEAWLGEIECGASVPFDALLARHPDVRAELEELARRDALAADALAARGVPSPHAAKAQEFLGRQLGDFRLVRELGRGGMGIVFEAEQCSLGRRVAIKVLPAQLTLSERAFQRFLREASVTARLKHPNIIDIHQLGEADGIHFIAMELVEGSPLDRIIERMRNEVGVPRKDPGSEARRARKLSSFAANKSSTENAIRIVCQVADALEHAHGAGVIHRDVKPSNILVRPGGQAVLTDFGLAREEGLPAISASGEFAGTPGYVSPEQALSGRVPLDHRTDVFSLGATLYELLTLHPPFGTGQAHEVLAAIVSREPVAPTRLNPALAPDLVTIVLKALEKDAARRYSTAAEMAADLRAFIEYRPIQARRASRATRTLRWVRREPLKATLAVSLSLGLPLGTWLALELSRTGRALEEVEAANSALVLPRRFDQAFLALGLGKGAVAEEEFRKLDEEYPNEESQAGLVMAVLMQGRAREALGIIELAKTSGPQPTLERLEVDALSATGEVARAARLEMSLKDPETPLEEFLKAVHLLKDCPYALELADFSYLPMGTVALRLSRPLAEVEKDVRLEHKDAAEQAIACLRRAITRDSDRAPYHFAMAWAAWVAHDHAWAADTARGIESKWGDSSIAWFYRGLALEEVDQEQAIGSYDRALELEGDQRAARERRAQLLVRRGELERGAEEFRKLIAEEPRRATYLAWLGAALLPSDPAAAAAASGDAIEQDPALLFAYRTRARAWSALGMHEQACKEIQRAVAIEPNDAILHSDLGLVLCELRRFAEAEEHLKIALRLDPSMPQPLFNLAWLHQSKGQDELNRARLRESQEEHEEAVRAFEEAFRRGEERPELNFPRDLALGSAGVSHQQLAILLDRQGDTAGAAREWTLAVESYRRACALAPENPDHPLNLGVALFESGAKAECIDPLMRALGQPRTPQQRAIDLGRVHSSLVLALQSQGRSEEALVAARAWCDAYPKDGQAWNQRAYLQADPAWTHERNVEEMLESAENAVRLLGEGDFGAQDTYALALHWAGDDEAARAAIERSIAAAQNAPMPPDERQSLLASLNAHAALFQGDG